jgi:hypothetical protein
MMSWRPNIHVAAAEHFTVLRKLRVEAGRSLKDARELTETADVLHHDDRCRKIARQLAQ